MGSNYKVWGGIINCPGEGEFEGCEYGEHRCLIRAQSQRRAVEIAEGRVSPTLSIGALRTYWSITSNRVELDITAGMQEGIWITRKIQAIVPKDNYVRIL